MRRRHKGALGGRAVRMAFADATVARIDASNLAGWWDDHERDNTKSLPARTSKCKRR